MREAYGVEAVGWLRIRPRAVMLDGLGLKTVSLKTRVQDSRCTYTSLSCSAATVRDADFERGPDGRYSGHSAGLNTDIKALLTALAVVEGAAPNS